MLARCWRTWRVLIALAWSLLYVPAAGASVLHAGPLPVDLAAATQVLEDPAGQMDFAQASSAAMAPLYRDAAAFASDGALHFGFSASAYWLRIRLQRAADGPRSWVLEIPYAQIEHIALHAPQRPPVITGSAAPLESRPMFHRFYAFPLDVDTEPQYVYVRVASQYALTVPLQAWTPEAFTRHLQRVSLVQYLYYGGLLALLAYNLFLFISLNDVRFLFYSLYALAFGIGMFAGNGYGRLFLWPGEPAFDENALPLFLCIAAVFAVAFTRSFLQTRQLSAWMDRALAGIGLVFLAALLFFVADLWWPMPTQWMHQVVLVTALAMCPLVLAASVKALRRGDKGARFFLLAWGVLWAGAAMAAARQFGWLPSNGFTLYALQIASALEMLLLSLALADMVHAERQRREESQALALQAHTRMLEVLRTSETRLELSVKERTLRLAAALANEKSMRAQYVRFGSVISHEFRNPLGIIRAQVTLARKEQQKGVLQLDKRLDVLESATQRLQALFDKWLQSDRLTQGGEPVNGQDLAIAPLLQRWLDAHRYLLAGHRVQWSTDPHVTHVWADEQLLEIAVVNLLENACKYSEPGTEVSVQVCRRPGFVGIAVADQGCGIAPEHQERVFQEFYRVAPEGSATGMGLGLSIVQRIAAAHGGSLSLDSTPGQGSRFCLWLPEHPTPESLP